MTLFYPVLLGVTLIVALFLYNIENLRIKQYILLIVNYCFYAYLDLRFLLLLLFTSAAVWFAALHIKKTKRALYWGIGIPLISLVFFKYLIFFCDSFSSLLGIKFGSVFSIVLPIGISFYTFLCISYLLDVYNEKIQAEESFMPVALYISFFPAVVSGPITKARNIIHQFVEPNPVCLKILLAGIQIFIIGCFKKVVLADRLAVFVDDVYVAPLTFDSLTVWLAVVTYSFQLYFDFSAYSDMAIGCARCLGFQLSDNFNLPYIAKNISDFWKRWHISLSAWFQEYLYIPLGGSREGVSKTYRNLLLTMLVCGLWHGAGWKFILWGGMHGVLLCLYRLYKDTIGNIIRINDVFSVLLTFLSVSLCLIFFRGSDMQNFLDIFNRLFIWETFGVNQMYIYSWLAILLFVAVAAYSIFFNNWQGQYLIMDITQPKYFFVFCVEVLLLLGLACIDGNPFVYARF